MLEFVAWSVLGLWTLAAALIILAWAFRGDEPDTPVEIRLGIAPESVRMNRTGFLLEFRFHILDPIRAAEWLTADGHACLMDQKERTVLPSLGFPKVQALGADQRALSWGDTRSILFADPERAMKPHERAIVLFGDARIEDLEIVPAE